VLLALLEGRVFVLGGSAGAGSTLAEPWVDAGVSAMLPLASRWSLVSLLGGGGGVPFLSDELLLPLVRPETLAGMKIGVCVRECVSGAETKDAVELIVPVRRGRGGGRSSLKAPSRPCGPLLGPSRDGKESGATAASDRDMLAARGTAGPGSGETWGRATWLEEETSVVGLLGFGGGCFLVTVAVEEERCGIDGLVVGDVAATVFVGA